VPDLGADDCANNNFEFDEPSDPIASAGRDTCSDERFPPSPGDPTGARCPLSAHIRKTYPRDDERVATVADGLTVNEADTQTHRLLRRGIPFDLGEGEARERGLLFAAYQTSIEEQFEFVTRRWVNNADFKEPGTGVDPILASPFVTPTGGGYFFSPAIHTLGLIARPSA
jgi:deferrochelatase/peroxidase EfeB